MTTKEIGEIRRTFGPGIENIIAGYILGLILLSAGCAGLGAFAWGFFTKDGEVSIWTWLVLPFSVAICVALVILGISYFPWIYSMSSFRVRVGQYGLLVIDSKSLRGIGWEEIVSVQETFVFARPEVLHFPAYYLIPKLESKRFKLQVKRGDPIEYDSNSIGSPNTLARMIKEETDRRGIPWMIVEEHAN
jgi:hypothetical protein